MYCTFVNDINWHLEVSSFNIAREGRLVSQKPETVKMEHSGRLLVETCCREKRERERVSIIYNVDICEYSRSPLYFLLHCPKDAIYFEVNLDRQPSIFQNTYRISRRKKLNQFYIYKYTCTIYMYMYCMTLSVTCTHIHVINFLYMYIVVLTWSLKCSNQSQVTI